MTSKLLNKGREVGVIGRGEKRYGMGWYNEVIEDGLSILMKER